VISDSTAPRPGRIAELFGIDLRTLALFRFALGSVLLWNLCRLYPDLAAFYTDAGVMPRAWMIEADSIHRLSLYFLNGSLGYAGLLLTLQAIAAAMLALGWHTRIASIVSFVLWGSLVNRNTLVLIGGDILIACLLFWAMFLPLAARFSVDAALARNPPPRENLHLSWASAGLLLQVMSVYFYSAILKSDPEWVPDYTAVYYTLQLDRYATPLGQWLLGFPLLLKGLSFFVWWLELLGPLLIFSPWFMRPLRFVIMASFMLMHIGFIFCLEIGHFPYVSLSSLTTFLGGWFWDGLDRRHRRLHPRTPTIYYDRDCGFCLKLCLLFRQFLVLPRVGIEPAQGHDRAGPLLSEHYSWVVIDGEDRAHLKWPAFVALLRYSPLFGGLDPLMRARIWLRPGNAVYDWVGRQRGAFGRLTGALLPFREVRWELGPRWQRVAAIFIVAVAGWNLTTIHALPPQTFSLLSPVLRNLRIDQYWNMFAPSPLKDDGWMVVLGTLADGSEIDLLHPDRDTPAFTKPHQYSQTHENVRWHTYRGRLYDLEFAGHRPYFAKYLCRSWNRDKIGDSPLRDRRLLRFQILYFVERTLPDYQAPDVRREVLWSHECFPRSESPEKKSSERSDRL
jgi:hypothetical protein